MNTTLLRTSALRSAARAGISKPARAGLITTFTRGKATLPDLPCTSPSIPVDATRNDPTNPSYQTTTARSSPPSPAK